ncbi:hypothetical protein D3C78_1668720 [compost metagenome]
MIGSTDKRWFIGLPSPAAAALVAGLVWICHAYGYNDLPGLQWVALGFTAFSGITMVTNVKFWSFKEIHLRRRVPFVMLLALVVVLMLLMSEPPLVLFGFFVCYALSGYVMALLGLGKKTAPLLPPQA